MAASSAPAHILILLCLTCLRTGFTSRSSDVCVAPPDDVRFNVGSAGKSLLQSRKDHKRMKRAAVVSNEPSTSTGALPPVQPKILRSARNKTTLFYHVHLPKTGGTTVAHLLISDICEPFEDLIPLRGWGDRCKVGTCEMGLTDNEFSCNEEVMPDRNHFEHNAFSLNEQRAETLKAKAGAERTVYVTTLRRGSDRVVSQWKTEVGWKSWVPPPGVPPYSMQSLRLYITGGPHTGTHYGKGWLGGQNIALRNNLQVGMLASRVPYEDTKPLKNEDLALAKKVLLSGSWIIGFTKCMPQLQEKLVEYSASLHGSCKDKAIPLHTDAGSEKHIDIDQETQEVLDKHAALDNELFDWAWALAADPTGHQYGARFTGIC